MLPMRGSAPDVELTGEFHAQPKIDGIRAVVRDGQVLSKSLKPIRSQYVQELFSGLEGADGELVVGPPRKTSPEDNVYKRTNSPIMTKSDKEIEVYFCIFDRWDMPDAPFEERLVKAQELVLRHSDKHNSLKPGGALFVTSDIVTASSASEIMSIKEYEAQCIYLGYEGTMLRRPTSLYKYGKATGKQDCLIKIKRFQEAEAMILGIEEGAVNLNELYVDTDGYRKRSSAKSGKVPNGMLGAFVCKDLENGWEFNIGTGVGLTDELRKMLFLIRDKLPGMYVKYKYQAYGTDEAARIPIWTGFRDPIDISELEGL